MNDNRNVLENLKLTKYYSRFVSARGKKFPSCFFVLDTETIAEEHKDFRKHRFVFGYLEFYKKEKNEYVKKFSKEFNNCDEMFNFILEYCSSEHFRKKKVYVFVHNLDFDLQVLTNLELQKKIAVKAWRVGSRVFRINNVVFVDTLNYFKDKLENLAKLVGEEKVYVDFSSKEINIELLKERCKKDVEILAKLLIQFFRFLKEHGFAFSYTLAGIAFCTLIRRLRKSKIYIERVDPRTYFAFWDLYRGGRNEIFRFVKSEECVLLDVNSMYPFVMKQNNYPVKIYKKIEKISYEKLKKLLGNLNFDVRWCAKVKLYIPEDIKISPIVVKMGGQLVSVKGYVTYYLTDKEIELCVRENCKVLSLENVLIFKAFPIFREFIDTLYAMRMNFKREKNVAYEQFCKLVMNSVYGKFAERRRKDNLKLAKSFNFDVIIDEDKIYIKKDNILEEVETSNDFRADRNFFVSAFITADARCYLYELMKECDFNVIYCDTDSLFVNKYVYEKLKEKGLVGEQLGKLKFEEECRVTLKACKFYDKNEKKKRKGIKANAVQLDENTFLQTEFQSLKSKFILRRLRDELENNVIYELKKIKKLTFKYIKGIVRADGSVESFYFRSHEVFDFLKRSKDANKFYEMYMLLTNKYNQNLQRYLEEKALREAEEREWRLRAAFEAKLVNSVVLLAVEYSVWFRKQLEKDRKRLREVNKLLNYYKITFGEERECKTHLYINSNFEEYGKMLAREAVELAERLYEINHDLSTDDIVNLLDYIDWGLNSDWQELKNEIITKFETIVLKKTSLRDSLLYD